MAQIKDKETIQRAVMEKQLYNKETLNNSQLTFQQKHCMPEGAA